MSEPGFRYRAPGGAVRIFLLLAGAAAVLVSCAIPDPEALTSEILSNPDSPLVHVRVQVKIGSANDPSGKEGLCRMTMSLLAHGGARTSPAAEIASRLSGMSAEITVSVDEEASSFSAAVPKDGLEAFYAVFKDMLLDPGFRDEDLERLKTDALARLEDPPSGEDAADLSRAILDRMIYEDGPYGRPGAGTPASVAGFSTVDARVFYGQHFVRGNIAVGVAGPVPAGFPARVLSDFKALPTGFTPPLRLPAPRRLRRPEVWIAGRPGAEPAVSIGLPLDPDMSAWEAAALRIAGLHLGRDGGASGVSDRSRRQKIFFLPVSAGNGETLPAAAGAAIEGLRTLVREGIPGDRFERLRASLIEEAPPGPVDGLAERLRARLAALPGRKEDDPFEARTMIFDLTRNDVDRAVRKYLDPDNIRAAILAPDIESLRTGWPPGEIRFVPAADVFRTAPPAPAQETKK